ncbi:type II/IV secretion system protein, partial [Candidatus Sumerlaeota bacterium]|nr:type II/IV secretion system protein [Candidatus Sumerlaeota bacterium]
GPTGCGKTTTLYAGLAEIKDPGDKLITVEDPVEYELPGIVQVNINEAVGLTFAKCLRSILRQDPDTVLVGEIRDVETAQIAVQASLTGHLVFSTLHTNSASATITRLIDMGVEPFLITSSVQAVIGQRLVRTVCPTCRATYRPSLEELEDFGVAPEDARDKTFYHGEGCHECGHTGYRGRMGLFELLEITDEIRDMILDQAGTDEIQEVARRNGMITMRRDGWLKICLGLTTFEEVARETPRDVAVQGYSGSPDGETQPTAPQAPAPHPAPAPQAAAPEAELSVGGNSLENEAAARVLERISKARF